VEKDVPLLPVEKFSTEFIDFIDMCLIRDPTKRPQTEVLLSHPFIKTYENKTQSDLAEWLINYNNINL
jgi:serine/threonine protein kinase